MATAVHAPLYPGAPAAVTASAFPPKKTAAASPTTQQNGSPIATASQLLEALGPSMTPQQMSALATKSAKDALAAMVAPYLTQQTEAQKQAANTAAQINAASRAAASSLAPLGDLTADDYTKALTQLAGLSSGFSGQVRQDADAEARDVQAQLAAIGAPQQAVNHGGELGNVLYGLGATIPGSPLVAGGLAATAAARALPAQVTSAGQQQALGAIQAGNARVQQIGDEISQAQSQLPSLVNQYLSSLAEQQSRQQANQISLLGLTKGSVVGDSKSGYRLVNPLTGQSSLIVPPSALGNTKFVTTTGGGITALTTDPATGKVTVTQVKSAPPSTKLVSTGRGGLVSVTTDPNTGQTTVTDVRDGTPYPAQVIKAGDGSVTAVGYGKDGKAFSIQVSGPKPTPPVIKGSPTGGYDVFDKNSGALLAHYPGTGLANKPPKFVSDSAGRKYVVTQTKKGWSVKLAPSTLGQPKPPSETSTGVAFNRVNGVINNATKHTPAHIVSGQPQIGTQKNAATFVSALAQALAVAPKSKSGRRAATQIVVQGYQNLITQMDAFANSADNANLKPADMLDQGLAQGFPSDLWTIMVQARYHSGETDPNMPSFVNPVDAVDWWITQRTKGI